MTNRPGLALAASRCGSGAGSEVSADPERLARLRREAQMLAALNHPNIAAIHTVGQAQLEGTGPVLFLDTELVEGMTLAQRLQGGPLSLQEALQVGRHVAEALEAAHERGIIRSSTGT